MTNPNDRAFPSEEMLNHRGLTKREYFAAMFMQGLLSNSGLTGASSPYSNHAKDAVANADSLIEALNKTKQP